jgi:DNA polymerase-4
MIIHLDLDCFFVSAERTRIPYLKGKPVVVCKSGDTKIFSREDNPCVMTESVGGFNGLFQHEKIFQGFDVNAWKSEFMDEQGRVHGIVIAKSYEAKAYGIKTGTPLRDALAMCPKLLVVSSDHLFYQLLSTRLKAFLQTKIPVLEQYSIDEFWGDLRGWVKDKETYDFMKTLQQEVLERFDLPVSIGASSSKWIAKLATDFNKPFGLTLVPKEQIKAFVSPQKIENFPGIGKAFAQKLHGYKIETLGELIEFRRLVSGWGRLGKELCDKVLGEDDEAVKAQRERSSIGIARNFAPIGDREELRRRVIILTRHLAHTMMKLDLHPTTYYFKMRYENGTKSKCSLTVDRAFSESFYRELALQTFAKLDTNPNERVHHLAMHASNFTSLSRAKTFSLLHVEEDEKAKRLSEKVLQLRDKYGVDIIRTALEKR